MCPSALSAERTRLCSLRLYHCKACTETYARQALVIFAEVFANLGDGCHVLFVVVPSDRHVRLDRSDDRFDHDAQLVSADSRSSGKLMFTTLGRVFGCDFDGLVVELAPVLLREVQYCLAVAVAIAYWQGK